MNTYLLLFILIIFISLIYSGIKLQNIEYISNNIAKFGLPASKRYSLSKVSLEITKIQIRQYRTQQWISFIVFLISVLLTLTISSIILFRLSLAADLNLKSIDNVVSFLSGLTLSVTSFQFYRFASKRYDEKVNLLHDDSSSSLQ